MSRRRLDRENHWRGILCEQSASGLSVAAFCRRASISGPSFYAWKRKLAERDKTVQAPRRTSKVGAPQVTHPTSAQIVPVHIESSRTTAPLRVFLPQGVCLEILGGQTALVDVLSALSEARLC